MQVGNKVMVKFEGIVADTHTINDYLYVKNGRQKITMVDIKDCTIIEPNIEIGDVIRFVNEEVTVIGIDNESLWVKFNDGSRGVVLNSSIKLIRKGNQ